MLLTRVSFANFRNITKEEITFSPGINLICGDNAQGKTNILEGIYYFSCLKSFRGVRDSDLIKDGETAASFQIAFSDEERNHENEIKLFKAKHKEMKKNGVRQKKASDMLGSFKCVIFAPEHLNLVKEGPTEKRRFMDAALTQIKPGYLNALVSYMKVLEQKNILLKGIGKKPVLYETLALWNEKLADYALPLFEMRKEFLREIEQKARDVHKEISGGKEEISLRYVPAKGGKKEDDEIPDRDAFLRHLNENEQKEISLGFSLYGPHRDDFSAFLNGQNIKNHASQGQQRSAVLSLKSAECELFKELYGSYPLLLLDDILSELDASRQKYITENIEKYQVILTCCEKDRFTNGENARVFSMENGSVVKA